MFVSRLLSPLLSRCVFPAFSRTVSPFHTHTAHWNSNRTALARYGRQKYERHYPVMLVRPDGSTITIRYTVPRRILMMPVDLATLPEEERRARLKRREARKTVKEPEIDFGDDFEADKYRQFWRKK